MAHAIVVGAGPAGAALAYLLASRGARVTLLERQTDFAREFRGEVLMPSGFDALAQMGLEARVRALPQAEFRGIEIYRNGRRIFRVELDPEAFGGPPPRVVSQPAMLEMLVAEGAHHPGFRLERGATVRDLLYEGERVTGVRAQLAGGSSDLHADFVIGADGRASAVRRRSGLHEERHPQSFDVVWLKVPLPAAFAEFPHARAYLGRGHFLLAFPAYDGLLQVAWLIDKGTFGELRARGLETWARDMAAHVSPDLEEHLRRHAANVTHPFLLDVVCDRLVRWTSPGLLMLGDAAHPMSPVAAQGINIALRDAIVAANHLAPLLAQPAPRPAALDAAAKAFEAERLPEVAEIQSFQERPPPILMQRTWWSPLVLAVALRILPWFARAEFMRGRRSFVLSRVAFGVGEVKLRV